MTDEELTADQDETSQEQEPSEEEQEMAKLKEAITVDREEIGALRMKLTVTVPRDTLDERMGKEFSDLKRDADVPGFRRGHAPMRLVEKRFGSDVGVQLIGQLIASGYQAATEKEDLKTLGDPFFWVKVKEERVGEDKRTQTVEVERLLPFDKAVDNMKMPAEGALTFSCEVELKPEFELPKLDKIPVKKPVIEIDDEDVETELKRMCMSRGAFAPVEGGEVEPDDMLYAGMKMTVEDEVIASEDSFDLAARDVRVKGVQLAGFGEAVVGKKIGETVTFEADVPEDHDNIDIRGKKAVFEFNLSEIKRLEVPPIDEEFLSAVGFESEKELREAVKSGLTASVDTMLKRGVHGQIGDYLVESTELDIPEGLSQRQAERTIARRMIEMLQTGVPEAEIKKSLDEMRARAHDQVVRDLKLHFILERIAEDREIEVPEEQINAAIADIARQSNKRFDRVRDELSKGEGLAMLYLQLRDERILESLAGDAEITETEGPKKKKSPKKKTAKKKKTEKKAKSD